MNPTQCPFNGQVQMKLRGTVAGAALLAGLIAIQLSASSAQAGETLFFKQGAVRTAEFGVDKEFVKDAMKEKSTTRRVFVVQFQDAITVEDHKNLETLGARVLRYIPDDALLVESTARVAHTIQLSAQNIRAVLPLLPRWKVSAELPPPSVVTSQNAVNLMLRFLPVQNLELAATQVRQISGVKVVSESGREMLLATSTGKIPQLAQVEGVEWIQPAVQIETLEFRDEVISDQNIRAANSAANNNGSANDSDQLKGDYTDLSGFETGTKVMNFGAAWARGYRGQGQIVGMADTGLDTGDMNSIMLDFRGRVPSGYPFGLFSKSWEDPMGHGTHVAGSVMGNGNVSGGLIEGGAPQASLVAESMWSPMLGNLSVPNKLGDLFKKAYVDGARIHTNSWGGAASFGNYDNFCAQVDEFLFQNQDMLVLFAAGNSGEDKDGDGRIDGNSISSPGTAKNVLTVGASKNYVLKGGLQKKLGEMKSAVGKWDKEPLASSMLSENANGISMFSSRGPTQDGRLKPEVVAPGTNILSARSHHKDAEPLWGPYNSDYVWSGGTSMATPLTAGGAAVVRQYLIEGRKVTAPSGALIKGVMMHTAYDMYPGEFGEIGKAKGQQLLTTRPNIDQGYGRVDLDAATDMGNALLVDEKTGLATGEVHKYPVSVSKSGKMTATLVYTDAPAAASAAKALVNDLDLEVVDSKGKVTSINDHINNNEMIMSDVVSGDYEVRVKGTSIPQGLSGKQPYALIISVK